MSVARKPKVAEVAARAGVSTATVDRVLNGRGGVAPYTVARVEDALRNIATPRQPARIEDILPCQVLLGGDGSAFVRTLGAELQSVFAGAGAIINVDHIDRKNTEALASGIATSVAQGCKSLVIQAVDSVAVRKAIDDAAAVGVSVVSVTTDVPSSRRHAYVGLDNRAAGRTAGLLMGRFCRDPGTLAIVWGGQLYLSHEERDSGFRSVLRADRPDLKCLEVITGDYTPARARHLTEEVIARHADLVGIYCIGGGVSGVAAAVEAAGRSEKIVLIGHNCNADTQPYLLSGTIAALVHQDVASIAAEVLAALLDRNPTALRKAIRTEIIMRENLM
jgi:LacI family transcriptional regulator